MIFEFRNLSEEEVQQLEKIEVDYPDDVTISTALAGFDGETAIELVCNLAPSIITSITTIIVTIIMNKKPKNEPTPTVFIVFENGNKKEIRKKDDIENYLDDENE